MEHVSTIGRGTTVRGSVRGEGHLDVNGRVEGSIDVNGDVTIGDGALVKSDVSGRNVVVRGAIAGSVSATASLILEAGARVVGDLAAPTIGIRPGALVRGNVSTEDGATTLKLKATVPAAVTKRPGHDSGARSQPAPQLDNIRDRVTTPAVARKIGTRPTIQVAAPSPRPVAKPPAPVELKPPSEPAADAQPAGPPPPVVPALRKGAKATLRRKNAR